MLGGSVWAFEAMARERSALEKYDSLTLEEKLEVGRDLVGKNAIDQLFRPVKILAGIVLGIIISCVFVQFLPGICS